MKQVNGNYKGMTIFAATALAALSLGTSAGAQPVTSQTGRNQTNGDTQNPSNIILPTANSNNGITQRETGGMGRLPIERRLRTLPQNVVPVMNRASDLLRLAERRAANSPTRAQSAYNTAISDLRHVLMMGGYSPNPVSGDGGSGIGGTITMGFVMQDVQTLRSAAANLRPLSEAHLLYHVADLYAAAGKSFLLGEQRVANQTNGGVTLGSTGTATATYNYYATPRATTQTTVRVAHRSARRSSRHPVSITIYGSRQQQQLARAQGLQALRDAATARAQAQADATAVASNNASTSNPLPYGYPAFPYGYSVNPNGAFPYGGYNGYGSGNGNAGGGNNVTNIGNGITAFTPGATFGNGLNVPYNPFAPITIGSQTPQSIDVNQLNNTATTAVNTPPQNNPQAGTATPPNATNTVSTPTPNGGVTTTTNTAP